VSTVHFLSEGWVYTPTLSTSGTQVNSILALKIDGTQSGSNIESVWFKKTGSTWRAYAWESTESQASVVKFVTDTLGVSAGTQDRWPIAPASTAASSGTLFTDGLFHTDAVLTTVQSSSNPRAWTR